MGFFSCALPRVTLLSSDLRGWYAYFRPRSIFHQPFLENAACFCSTNWLVHGKLLSSSSLAQLTWDCTAICTNSGCYWCAWTGPIPLHALSFFFFFHSLFHSLTKRVNLLWIFARSFFFFCTMHYSPHVWTCTVKCYCHFPCDRFIILYQVL